MKPKQKKRKQERKRRWSKTEIIALMALIIDTIFRIIDLIFK